ncbi:hypothetical protein [Buttiauxella noackiae]|uniref:toxin-antitoxin system YwqK family antitoxin n=1 Tax=Buttiauxella noackiae TaxID=82992 RepID=UPI0028D0571A|nr:hypothetical protein [Buttiauxella noackiae]
MINYHAKTYIGLLCVNLFFSTDTFAEAVTIHSTKYFDEEKGRQVIVTKYNNDKLESFQEFINEVPNGVYESWWRNGERKYKTYFSEGKENGMVSYWFRSGRKQFSGNMKEGVLDGELVSLFESGKMRTKENYAKGQRIGTWMSWYENKKQSSLLIFNSGVLIKCTSWDSTGGVIYRGDEKSHCENIFNSNYAMSIESEDPI